MTYHTQDKHDNHYTTDALFICIVNMWKIAQMLNVGETDVAHVWTMCGSFRLVYNMIDVCEVVMIWHVLKAQ
jgi:hypothetical protein